MSKQYKLIYNFKDGEAWDERHQNVSLTAEQIQFMLSTLEKYGERGPLELESNPELKRTIGDLKSIEVVFE